MLLSANAAQEVDLASARLVASAIDACTKFVDKSHTYSAETLADLQTVDLALIEGAIDSAER